MNSFCPSFAYMKNFSLKSGMLLLLLWAIVNPALAQVVFEAKVDRKQVPINEQVKVSFTIKNGSSVKGFSPPDFNPFRSRGPSTSSSMQIINGNVSKSESFSYFLTPTKKGKFTIAPATVMNDGKKITSNSIQIEVVDASERKNKQGNSNENSNINDEEIAKNLYVRVIPNKRKAVKGEEIILTYKLFSRVRTSNINYTKTPQYNGFLHHEIELSQDAQRPKNEVVDGEQFQTQTFRKVALFPTQAGTLKIPAIEFSADVLFQERDPFFRNSFFTRTKRYPFEFKSNSISVEVEELPSSPQGFTGGVGQLNYSVNYDKTETAANDPITLKINMNGTGNIGMLNIPDINFPASFELYDPKIKENIRKSGTHISGSKTYEYLIVPRGGGEFQIPDISLSHFDPEAGSYVTKNFEGPLIKVNGEVLEESAPGNVGSAEAGEIDVLNKDIRYIKAGSVKEQSRSSIINAPWFWMLSSLPLVALFGLPYLVAGFRIRKRTMASKGELAEKNALKKIKAIDPNKDRIENDLQNILWGYISEKTKIPIASLNKEKAKEALYQKLSNTEHVEGILRLIEQCELLAYSPNPGEKNPLLKEEILTLFKELSKK